VTAASSPPAIFPPFSSKTYPSETPNETHAKRTLIYTGFNSSNQSSAEGNTKKKGRFKMTAEQMTAVNEKLSDIERLFDAPAQAGKQSPQPVPIQIPATSSADSQLFTVRLWPEAVGDDLVEWRGKVDHVASGEGYYFRDWSRLIVCLEMMLRPGFRTGFGVG
jgi:hypothetical protein